MWWINFLSKKCTKRIHNRKKTQTLYLPIENKCCALHCSERVAVWQSTIVLFNFKTITTENVHIISQHVWRKIKLHLIITNETFTDKKFTLHLKFFHANNSNQLIVFCSFEKHQHFIFKSINWVHYCSTFHPLCMMKRVAKTKNWGKKRKRLWNSKRMKLKSEIEFRLNR